jgi:REP element-mobilizing transposase RayT
VKTAEIRRDVVLGKFVIMPNHFHGILRIVGNDKANPTGQEFSRQVIDRQKGDRQVAPTGAIMAGFKSAVTKRINTMHGTPGEPVWQRTCFEHIMRDDTDYKQIAEYVLTNPRTWKEDQLARPIPPLVVSSGFVISWVHHVPPKVRLLCGCGIPLSDMALSRINIRQYF